MLKDKRLLGALLSVLMLGLIPYATFSSRTYHQCQAYHQAQTTNGQQYKSDPFVNVRCAVLVYDKHNGFITALATVFLTWLTWQLAVFSHQQTKTTRIQLRAYLSVVIGPVTVQDRTKNLKFEVKPVLENKGQTPAYRVRYNAKARIIPTDMVENFNFAAIEHSTEKSETTVGPGETRVLGAIVPDYVPDTEVHTVKVGVDKALWVWGILHYEDAFGEERFVEFCQRYYWIDDDTIQCVYDPRFSRAN